MKILITGGAGFIGSNLIRLALARGHEVLNLDKLTYSGNIHSLADLEGCAGYRFVRGDITDGYALRSAFEEFSPAVVIHLAAESHVDRSIDGPGEFIQTNIVGTYRLLEAARYYWLALPTGERDKFRLLHVSTDEVYGSLGEIGLFTESTPYSPHSPYSASKAASDHLARAWHDTYGLPTLVTNCSNNYGPYQFPEKLIPVTILKAIGGSPIPVYGDGRHVRDWLYVNDHAAALLAVAERGAVGETYNIGGGNEVCNLDLVRLLCGILDEFRPRQDGRPYSEQITFVADRPGHDLRYAIDSSKIRQKLGWKPDTRLDEGLRKTVRWYLDNQKWWQPILDGNYRMERLGTR